MTCGICGGGVRLYSGSLHGRPISDWKHTSAPPGTVPHRPVLGTPVSEGFLGKRVEVVKAPPEVVTSVVPHRPVASDDEYPAAAMVALGEGYGWELVEPAQYMRGSNGVETCAIKLRRRELGAVAFWERKAGEWGFSGGYTLVDHNVQQVQSKQLKAFLKQRDEQCPDCGRSSLNHREECG